MKKFYNTTKIIFLALFALYLIMCIYEGIMALNPRCLIDTGLLALIIYAYLPKKEKSIDCETGKEQENRLLNNMPIAAFYTDLDGKYLYGNGIIAELLNTTVENLKNINIFTDYFEEAPLDYYKRIGSLFKEKKTVTDEQYLKFPNTDATWYKISQTPVYDENGKMILVFVQNIGAEKTVYQQKEHFEATLCHDLKTPIIAQIRSLELLMKGTFGKIPHAQKEIITLNIESCKNMYNMISTILYSYKFENNEIKLLYEDVILNELIIECCDELAEITKENKVEIVINSTLQNDSIIADRRFLKFAVLYLIENSISYAYEDTTVEILTRKDNDNIIFEVNTESPYISSGALHSMFDSYLGQTANYNKIGFCMKLYYTKQIIKAHKGEIIAHSYSSNNNTLGFKIPCFGGIHTAIA